MRLTDASETMAATTLGKEDSRTTLNGPEDIVIHTIAINQTIHTK